MSTLFKELMATSEAHSYLPAQQGERGRSVWPLFAWVAWVMTVIAGFFFAPPLYWMRGGRITQSVYIESVPVGGLLPEEAIQAIRSRGALVVNPTLTLISPVGSWNIPLARCGGEMLLKETMNCALHIGRTHDLLTNTLIVWKTWYEGKWIPVHTKWDRKQLHATLQDIARKVNVPPLDATVGFGEGKVRVIEGREGCRFHIESTAERIIRDFSIRNQTVAAAVQILEPRVTAEDVQTIDGVVAKFTTAFSEGQRNRARNIRTACSRLNGHVIMPGETFSFNATTGPRTAAKGYRIAPILDRKRRVLGIGGGVCQVSTTLYNCARHVGLPITERHPHSLPVPYVRAGRDATVMYPYRDLKFTNNLATPIAIWTHVARGRLTIYLLGQATRRVSMRNDWV